MNVKAQAECRICGGELHQVLDLGTIYHSSFVDENYVPDESEKAPLVLSRCKNCGLVQLRDTVDLDVMYKKQYWYSSSLNKSMVSSLKDVVNDIEAKIDLKDGDVIIDIGCNDGTLFDLYTNKNLYKIGVDPAPNLSKPNCQYFVNDYFASDNINLNGKKARVISAIAMFYDLPDPNKFVNDLKNSLADDGLVVIQFTDLLSMFDTCAFDNICHEHLEYYRLEDVMKLLESHELSVIDVSYNDVNGGSLRVTACHSGAYSKNESVSKALTYERNYFKQHSFEDFGRKIEWVKGGIRFFFDIMKFMGKKVFLLGASTKGNTLLQICGITDKDAPYAAEVNKDKFGLKTLGSNIKILSEDEAFSMKPDYLFVPVWHFKSNLLTKKTIREFVENGGHLYFPLPISSVIGKDNIDNE